MNSLAPSRSFTASDVAALDAAALDDLAKQDLTGADLSGLSDRQLRRLERRIALRFLGKDRKGEAGFPWVPVIWGLGNTAIFIAMWPLVFMGLVPLWLGCIINTICGAAALLPSHEAQHENIARPGSKLRWLNELVGRVSLIPLAGPYKIFKITHMDHHRFCNIPETDPDYSTHAKSAWHFLWKSVANRQPKGQGGVARYVQMLTEMDTKESRQAIKEGGITQMLWLGFMFTLAWNGYAIEALCLWWVPRHLGLTYIRLVLSWLPHHPAVEQGRYRNTRAFKSKFGNILTSGMEYHIVHHLYPNIPINRTPAAYWALKPVLVARGAELGEL